MVEYGCIQVGFMAKTERLRDTKTQKTYMYSQEIWPPLARSDFVLPPIFFGN